MGIKKKELLIVGSVLKGKINWECSYLATDIGCPIKKAPNQDP